MIKVKIVQPFISHYRVPFLEALAARRDLEVQVHCSEALAHAYGFDPGRGNFACIDHPCDSFLGRRLFWQGELGLTKDLGSENVVVVCGNPRFLSNYPLIYKAKRRNIGVVWWGHGWTPGAHRLTAAIRRVIMRCADVILLYTEQEVEDYKRYGFDPNRLFAANNTLDQEPIRQAMQAWSAVSLAQFRIDHRLGAKRVLLFCGRVVAKTKLHLVLDALQLLCKGGDDYLLAVVGEGQETEALMRYALRSGVNQNVRWLGPMFDQRLLAPWFLSADCFVYPGAIGLSLLHAFGYGLPVVTHNNRRNHGPEIAALQDGENGLLFREGDPDDLAAKIRYLITHPACRRRLSDNALDTISNRFSMAGMVERFTRAVYAASRLARDARQGTVHGLG